MLLIYLINLIKINYNKFVIQSLAFFLITHDGVIKYFYIDMFQSLGNNELEYGSKELSPFLNNIDTNILASNVILKNDENNEKIQKSIILDIKGVKVGIVGYLTPDYNILDSSGNIEYIDEVIALTDEVSKLRELDVNIIIALGHSRPEKNIEIAREVDDIDLVICGHKNNFFWNGTSTDYNIQDTLIVTQSNGKEVPVIYSYAYDKYLGNLIMSFDNNGQLIKFNSNPITLDSSIVEDLEFYSIAEKYLKELSQTSEEVVGNTSVVLDGEHCKTEECNLGNLITDAIMYYNAINFETEEPWTDAPIAIIHGGAIAASISPSNRPASVTRGDLLSALPLASNIVAVTVNGTTLSQVLEHSVADYDSQNPSGRFLQYSGIRVVYDIAREPGSRVVSAVARCGTCYVPEFYNIDNWRTYRLLMPAALADGEYGYTMFNNHPRENHNHDEVTCTADYINRRSPVYPEVAGRVVLQNVPIVEVVPDSASALSSSLIFIVILLFCSRIVTQDIY